MVVSKLKRAFLLLSAGIAMLPFLLYIDLLLRRPPRTPKHQQLFRGVVYQRVPRSVPRPMVLHIVSVDLTAPGIDLLVTPGQPAADDREVGAQTTASFLETYGLQLAINGSFFKPFYSRTPFDYYPRSGDRVDAIGQAISSGTTYSPAEAGWSVLCLSADQIARIAPVRCPMGTMQGVLDGIFCCGMASLLP